MTPRQYARVEAVAALIDFLDLLDGDPDLEPETDGCPAHDDDPRAFLGAGDWLPGDPDDAEPEEDCCVAGDDSLIVRPRTLGEGDRGSCDDDHEDSDGLEGDCWD